MLQYRCDDDQGGPQPKPPSGGWKKGDDKDKDKDKNKDKDSNPAH
jgi:hypothetical protein